MKSKGWPSDVFMFFHFPKPPCQSHLHRHRIVHQSATQSLHVEQAVPVSAVKALSTPTSRRVPLRVPSVAVHRVLIIAVMWCHHPMDLCAHPTVTLLVTSLAQHTVAKSPRYPLPYVQLNVKNHVISHAQVTAAHRNFLLQLQRYRQRAIRFVRHIVFHHVQRNAARSRLPRYRFVPLTAKKSVFPHALVIAALQNSFHLSNQRQFKNYAQRFAAQAAGISVPSSAVS